MKTLILALSLLTASTAFAAPRKVDTTHLQAREQALKAELKQIREQRKAARKAAAAERKADRLMKARAKVKQLEA